MSLGWSDTYTDADDLSNLTFCQMIRTAIAERASVSIGGSPTIPTISLGGDFHNAPSLWTVLQTLVQSAASTGVWLKNPDLSAAAFTDIAGDSTSPSYVWTWDDLVDTYLGGNGWTRKYPKEMANVSTSTSYIDSSSFVNGDNARSLNDGLVYTRTAGAWVAATVGTFPDAVTAYGYITAGDYVGPWIFNEMRDILDALRDAAVFVTAGDWVSGGSTNFKSGSASGQADAATAESVALGVYASSGSTVDTPPGVSAWSDDLAGSADVARVRAKMPSTNPSSLVGASAEFWSFAEGAHDGISHPIGFDAMGDTVADGVGAKWDTQSVLAGAAVTSSYLGSLGNPTFPAARDGRDSGWGVGGSVVVVFRYATVGGYTNYT